MLPRAQQLGDFVLGREIGRGGMGVVFEARQVSLNRKAALKVLGLGLGLTERAIDRFRHEAELLPVSTTPTSFPSTRPAPTTASISTPWS